MNTRNFAKHLVILTVLGVLAACGGGSGSGSGSGSTPAPPPAVKAWQTAALIETDNGNADSPQIAIAANGNALAVWVQLDVTHVSIWASSYR